MSRYDDAASLREKADDLRAEARRLEGRARHLEALPRDKFEEGTVLVFTRQGRYGTRQATYFKGPLKYAAVKAGNQDACWFLTGLEQHGKTWEDLLTFIGEKNYKTVRTMGWDKLHVATGEHIPPDFHQYHHLNGAT